MELASFVISALTLIGAVLALRIIQVRLKRRGIELGIHSIDLQSSGIDVEVHDTPNRELVATDARGFPTPAYFVANVEGVQGRDSGKRRCGNCEAIKADLLAYAG